MAPCSATNRVPRGGRVGVSGPKDAIRGTALRRESRPGREMIREVSEDAIRGTAVRHESRTRRGGGGRGLCVWGWAGGGFGGVLWVFGSEGRDSWHRVPPRIASRWGGV